MYAAAEGVVAYPQYVYFPFVSVEVPQAPQEGIYIPVFRPRRR
jgi:hypothetical protein